jgi:molybdate transport system substrate-binding protein
VYQTDAVADKGVKILDAFPDNSHPPIIYPIAAMASSTNPGDAVYIAYLKSPAVHPTFEKQGFTVLE